MTTPGVTLAASGFLPPEYTAIINSHIKVYERIQKSSINWTYFSPAGIITRGERTGDFRLGKDDLITDSAGNSKITYEDYAVALVEELEKPQFEHSRFTIGY